MPKKMSSTKIYARSHSFVANEDESDSGMPEHIFEWGLGMSCKSTWEYVTMAVVGRK